jgi:aryl-alcohol dehydrogenase-like predicted oxidoreductase
MKYRKLGRTGIEVSELIFGCGDVGGLLVKGDPDDMVAGVRRALDEGVNWFDTAAAYGQGKSEISLGRVLKSLGANPHVSTKVRLDTAKLGDIAGEVERSVAASLTRLGRDRVDLLQFHNAVTKETGERSIGRNVVLKKDGVADALARMRDRGFTRFVGFTALGEAASCRQVIESGRFDAAQIYCNMLNPSAARAMPARWTGQDFGNLIAACRAQDMGVIAIRAMAAGILAGFGRPVPQAILTSDTDMDEEERKTRAVFEALGGRAYGTQAQAAVRFVLANPDVSAVNVGFATPAQIDEALAACAAGPLPASALAALDRLYDTDFRGM